MSSRCSSSTKKLEVNVSLKSVSVGRYSSSSTRCEVSTPFTQSDSEQRWSSDSRNFLVEVSCCLHWLAKFGVLVQRRAWEFQLPRSWRSLALNVNFQLAIADFVRLLLQYCKLKVKFHNPLYSLSFSFHDIAWFNRYNDFANSNHQTTFKTKAYYQYDGKSLYRDGTSPNYSWLVLSWCSR